LNGEWFDRVLAKMPDGALVLTDCGNIEQAKKPNVPWSLHPSLNNWAGRSAKSMSVSGELNFQYGGRVFTYLGAFGMSCKHWPVHGWQINRMPEGG